ncbi:hypothetical protein ACGFH8_00880 [Micromonospora sp. NPDC049175]|uniref:hypothetical protein n=1 Tax=Micromonospora sp. NPDC049175 TaxID=3364266 RepID=UPI0037135E46
MATSLARRTGHGLTYAVLGWAVAYGGVRLAWAVGETPEFRQFGSDLLALVHRWGEVWPGWVPLLAGRTIPRLLLLVPGFGLGAGIVAYFGMGLVQLVSGSASEFSDTFLWVAMSAYWVLGLGLVVASGDYHLRTRGACAACGR